MRNQHYYFMLIAIVSDNTLCSEVILKPPYLIKKMAAILKMVSVVLQVEVLLENTYTFLGRGEGFLPLFSPLEN